MEQQNNYNPEEQFETVNTSNNKRGMGIVITMACVFIVLFLLILFVAFKIILKLAEKPDNIQVSTETTDDNKILGLFEMPDQMDWNNNGYCDNDEKVLLEMVQNYNALGAKLDENLDSDQYVWEHQLRGVGGLGPVT